MSAPRYTFHLIPHTHWDREWYLPAAVLQARLAAAGTALVELLGRDPGACYTLDGQAILIPDLLEVRPDLLPPLAAETRNGRLAVGPWYILADELIPAGESLLRNLEVGRREALALGRRLDVCYSPDAFGHPAMLPLIAAEFGLRHAVVWRGLAPLGEDTDFYRWIAPSGESVLLHHLPRAGYESGSVLLTGVRAWPLLRRQLVDRAAGTEIGVFVGADHHAPPPDLSGLVRRLQALEPKHRVRLSTLGEFLEAAAATPMALPELRGELRWSYGHTWTLQGVHGTRARQKREHARAELGLLRLAEPLTSLAILTGRLDAQDILRSAWRRLLRSQFHDTLAGTGSDEVANAQAVRLAAVAGESRELVRIAVDRLSGHDPDRARDRPRAVQPSLLLWNPVPRARRGIVTGVVTVFRSDVLVGPPSGRRARTAPPSPPFALATAEGREIPVQVLSVEPAMERLDAMRHYPDQDLVDRVRVAFEAPRIDGFALDRFIPVPNGARPRNRGLHVQSDRLHNRFFTVRVSPTGRLTIDDHRSGRRLQNLLQFEDERDEGDSYTPFIPAGRHRTVVEPGERRVLASGPLVGALEVRFRIRGATPGRVAGRLVVELRADSPLIRLQLELENGARDHRLRVRLPVGAGDAALAGAAFGFEWRAPVNVAPGDYPAERPVATAPAQRYVAAGDTTGGLAVLMPGFFEYEWTARQSLLLTLIRSIGELSRGELPPRPGHAGWPMPIPGAQEQGRHQIEFALLPLERGDWQPERLEQWWEDAWLPPMPAFRRSFSGSGQLAASGITLHGAGLNFTACTPAAVPGAIVLRCSNLRNEAVAGRWTLATPVARATRIRADGTPIATLRVREGSTIPFTAPPRGLVSILIEPLR